MVKLSVLWIFYSWNWRDCRGSQREERLDIPERISNLADKRNMVVSELRKFDTILVVLVLVLKD